MNPNVILVVEDEVPILRFLRAVLAAPAYKLIEAQTGREGLAMAGSHNPDLVLLDLGLPDQDGLEVLQQLREWSRVPVIVVSARGHEKDKISALDSGADDYLTKPFNTGELQARIRVCLRRHLRGDSEHAEPVYINGGLKVDHEKRRVFVDDKEVHLTPIEYKLLGEMIRHAGKVLTHNHLLKAVWGPSHADESHYLRIFVGQLRKKLERDTTQPQYILTETGIGYRLKSE